MKNEEEAWFKAMKVLKKITATAVILCVLALSAMAEDVQRKDPKPPPPKQGQEVPNPPKSPPPPREGNKGANDNRRGKP